ncbi:MAG TPA: M48 family metallopeptidase, partial [Hyphomicrobiales bacterium]|nr:M48 family metallopeptidase [Hyphomicrobiales bacterium]
SCEIHPGKAALQRLLNRLQSGGDYGPAFKLHVAKAKMANAFALPGRRIVLLSGLIKQANSPEEVAGVLAHEMGHGLEKDPERLFVRNVGTQTVIQLLTGQSGNQSPLALGAIFLQLSYSREAERSADAHAIEILRKARIGPKATAEFFLRNARGDNSNKGEVNYLSTHPSSSERAKLFLSQPDYATAPTLSAKEWADAKAICDEAGSDRQIEERKAPDKQKSRKA